MAQRFGRGSRQGTRTSGAALAKENYNEEISDALKRAHSNLLDNPAFQAAWAGRPASLGASISTPAAMKAKILELMKEGIGTDVIARYVRGVKISPPLGPDDLIDWKRSGIPEAAIEAALPDSGAEPKARR